jgi:nucleotide-binding universal stress UspA family protein
MKVEALAAGVREVEARILEGTPSAQIVSCAEKEQFDLIVLGARGKSGLSKLLLGSVADKVVSKAPCSVLTVRGPENPA